jgi:hypothetical protein
MPPWKPVAGYGPAMIGERRLTRQQIATIQLWLRDGALEGPPDALPRAPQFIDGGWQLGQPDLVIGTPEAYTVPAGGQDLFRHFVLRISLPEARYVKGIEFQPTNGQIMHHATMRIDKTNASRRLDDQDSAPGYFGVTPPSAVYPDGYILAWTPGQVAPFLPQGMAWRLESGDSLVIQIHIVPTDRSELVNFRVGFYFADRPPNSKPATLRLGRQDIDIAPGQKDYVLCDEYLLPVAVDVLSVQPHAHYLAKEIKGFAILPNGEKVWLIYIKDWDFHWQDVYQYRAPIRLPMGSTVHMEYSYDNSVANPQNRVRPVRRVRYGEQTDDEMGLLWIQVLPVDQRALPVLTSDWQKKELEGDILGYRARLDAVPSDTSAHGGLAKAYLAAGRLPEALAHASEAARLQPTSGDAHYNLGTVLVEAGRLEPAALHFGRAIEIDPNDATAHNSLGVVFLALHRVDDALREFREAVRIDPQYTKAQNNVLIALREKRLIDDVNRRRP